VVHAVPALAQPVMHLGSHALTPYALLQHGSTLLGLLWLARYVRRRLRETPANESAACLATAMSLRHRLFAIAGMIMAASIGVWAAFAWTTAPLSAYNFVCRCISSAAIVAAIYALYWHAAERRRAARLAT
jgi:hypothetical protein